MDRITRGIYIRVPGYRNSKYDMSEKVNKSHSNSIAVWLKECPSPLDVRRLRRGT